MTEILPIGTVVAGYRVDGFLGEGGMGVVYEATQLSLDRKVALKIVAPRFSADSGFRARFRREGLIQARVEHENIVSAYEAGDHDGLLFLAMRLVRGSSLKEVLETRELSAPTALCILRAVADALDSAHEAGLIHRDVKPHNILVGPRDHPYLADFGITKDAGNTGFTRTGQIMGSLDYIAPEQIRGEHVTASCDIYALGAVLFECLAGVVPFVKQSEAALLYAHVAEPPPKISEHHPQLPATLDKVIAWGMAKEPSERPSTATALIEAAEDCLKQGSNPVVGEMTGISQEIPPAVIGSADTRKTPFAVLTDDAADSEPHVEASSAARSVVAEDREEVADPLHPSRDFEGALLLRRRIRPALLGFIAVAMAIVGAGYAIGHSSASGALASSRYTLTAGAASVTPSGNWSRIAVPSVPGLSFRRPAAAHSPTGYVFALGLLSGSEGRSLLPESFEKGLKSKPSPDGVRLGEAAAFRYQNLQVKGSSRPVTLMLVPTTTGTVALLCVAPIGAQKPSPTCEGTAGTLRLPKSDLLPLGPNPEYASQLSLAMSKAQSAEASERILARARTRTGQARLSSILAREYGAAAVLLKTAKPGPDAAASNGRLLDALELTAREFSAMAAAARRGKPDQFREAAVRRLTSQRSIRSVLATLRSDGYR